MSDDPRLEALGGLSSDANLVAEELDNALVVIRTNRRQALLAVATANLIARLVPSVEVACDDRDSEIDLPVFGTGCVTEIAARVIEQARLVPPHRTKRTLTISMSGHDNGADIHVGASAWSISLARTPHPFSGTHGPATSAASALAAAEAVRHLVPAVPGRRLVNNHFLWNLLDYRCTIAPAQPGGRRVDAVCFGGGSVGSSLVYALLLGEATGSITVVDPDKLTNRNRVRYPMLLHPPNGAKATWLESASRGTALSVTGSPMTASEFVAAHSDPIPLGISAVDSVPARRDVADALARRTLNAGVAGQQFHVSRHSFNDGFACVYCGYLDVGSPLDDADVYSKMSGLTRDRVRWLLDGDTLSSVDVKTLISRGVVGSHERAEFEGGRLQDVIRRRAYAQAEIKTGRNPVAMAAPYVSALAGAVLAAEVEKETFPEWWLNRRIDVDCSGYPTGLQSRPPQDQTGRCLCRDPFRQRAYREAWLA